MIYIVKAHDKQGREIAPFATKTYRSAAKRIQAIAINRAETLKWGSLMTPTTENLFFIIEEVKFYE